MQLRLFLSLSLSAAVFVNPLSANAQPNFGQANYDSGASNRNPGSGYPPEVVNGGLPAMNQGPYQQMAPGPGQFSQMPGQLPPAGQFYPQQGQYLQPVQPVAAQKTSPQQAAKVFQWFLKYDEIRRRAQMNPIEKQQADGLLARGLGLFMPGQDKMAAKQLLSGLVMRYQNATQSLLNLEVLPETKQLQERYYQYFDTAMRLFADYLKVQDNVFAVDNSGQSIAKQLIQRKLMLETLEHSCKDLDARMRQSFAVPAYQY